MLGDLGIQHFKQTISMIKTVCSHFKLKSDLVEFFNVPIEQDLRAFVCPFLIAHNKSSTIAREIYNQMTHFLTALNNAYIKPNDKINGMAFLSHLHEPNEYHLGYSHSNTGKAISEGKSEIIFNSLRNNRFAKQGVSVTNEAHNVLLLVDGIGQDIMSDTIANVCRNVFSEFTEKMSVKYNLPRKVFKIEYYSSNDQDWKTKKYNLPFYTREIILVPKFIISGLRAYSTYYNRFIAKNHIAVELMKKSQSNFKRNQND